MPRLFRISRTLCLSVCLTVPCLAVTDNGTPGETCLRQIQTSLQQGNWEEARRQLGDAINHFPRQSSLYSFMGVVEGQTGNYRAAETNFRRALEISPRFTGAAINLGKLYQENSQQDAGALAKALQVYRRILTYEPANAEARYQSTIICLRQGQYRMALAELAHLPADVQGRPQSLAARCAGLAGLDKDDEAGRVAGTLLVHPELSAQDVLLVLPFLEKKELEERLLDGLTSRSLHSAESLRQLGLFYERHDQLDRSRQILERAATSPVSVSLLLDLARVAYKSGDLKGALR